MQEGPPRTTFGVDTILYEDIKRYCCSSSVVSSCLPFIFLFFYFFGKPLANPDDYISFRLNNLSATTRSSSVRTSLIHPIFVDRTTKRIVFNYRFRFRLLSNNSNDKQRLPWFGNLSFRFCFRVFSVCVVWLWRHACANPSWNQPAPYWEKWMIPGLGRLWMTWSDTMVRSHSALTASPSASSSRLCCIITVNTHYLHLHPLWLLLL